MMVWLNCNFIVNACIHFNGLEAIDLITEDKCYGMNKQLLNVRR